MHEILHLIGLCPDSLTHLDLTDILQYFADPGIRTAILNYLKYFK